MKTFDPGDWYQRTTNVLGRVRNPPLSRLEFGQASNQRGLPDTVVLITILHIETTTRTRPKHSGRFGNRRHRTKHASNSSHTPVPIARTHHASSRRAANWAAEPSSYSRLAINLTRNKRAIVTGARLEVARGECKRMRNVKRCAATGDAPATRERTFCILHQPMHRPHAPNDSRHH